MNMEENYFKSNDSQPKLCRHSKVVHGLPNPFEGRSARLQLALPASCYQSKYIDNQNSMTVMETDALSALLGDLVAAKERDAPISELQVLITRGSMTVLSYKVNNSPPFPLPFPTPVNIFRSAISLAIVPYTIADNRDE